MKRLLVTVGITKHLNLEMMRKKTRTRSRNEQTYNRVVSSGIPDGILLRPNPVHTTVTALQEQPFGQNEEARRQLESCSSSNRTRPNQGGPIWRSWSLFSMVTTCKILVISRMVSEPKEKEEEWWQVVHGELDKLGIQWRITGIEVGMNCMIWDSGKDLLRVVSER